MRLSFATGTATTIPLLVVESAGLDAALSALSDKGQVWAKAQEFTAALGQILTVPDSAGAIAQVLVGYGTSEQRARSVSHGRNRGQATGGRL